MLKVIVLPVGQLRTNCYLLQEKNSSLALLIDPGDDFDFIVDKITSLNLSPQAILATHGHYDHILSALELQLAYKIPFLVAKEDVLIVKRMEKTARYFGVPNTGPPPKISRCFKKNEKIRFGNHLLKVISTPGHTPGSVCFYLEKEQILFSGDTIFARGGYGRTDLAGGDATKMIKSIKTILQLPEKTIIYPGHGEASTVEREKRFFRFL